MGIALGRPDLGVAQQPPNHFQRGSTGHQQGCEGVAQIVDTNVEDFGLYAHPFPEPLEIDHRLARNVAGAVSRLRDDRFAVWVIGDVCDAGGFFVNLPGRTVEAFEGAGPGSTTMQFLSRRWVRC